MKRYNLTILLAAALLAGSTRQSLAQVVAVTVKLDTNIIAVGQSTTLRVFAQVVPTLRTNADRIFTWYVDVLNTNGTTAGASYNALQKSASDNDPQLSSNGFNNGAHRLGIYDTFLNRPGAGVSTPVELMSIPVIGLVAGQTRFGVLRGTGVANLSEDFLVAPTGGGSLMTGGNYSTAFANLTVLAASSNAINCLTITQVDLGGGANQVTVQFCPLPGYNHYVEYRDQLGVGAGWQAFPGGPHNSGNLIVTNSSPQLFFRIRAAP